MHKFVIVEVESDIRAIALCVLFVQKQWFFTYSDKGFCLGPYDWRNKDEYEELVKTLDRHGFAYKTETAS